ncbi:response regulator transcription factor [Candidatus Dojkabacteria bacterium]|jgi:DNA-binding response OmpR family regulator|nr:response regulator transcription factor [Candidatus Dojkabacteria bacterium]
MKILIIEDEKDIALPIGRVLKSNGYQVDTAFDGNAGLEFVKLNTYDCVILDLNLPGVDGLDIAKYMRENSITYPILMLTARSQMYDKLTGFETGADDYLVKPFDMDELLARVRALINRSSLNTLPTLTVENIKLDFTNNKVVFIDTSKEVVLSNKESAVLEYLIRNIGKVVSSEELLSHVWDSNVDMFTNTVKTHIATLRNKLEKSGKIIRTIRGKGYIIDVDHEI